MNHQLLKGIMLCSATFAITSAASLIRTNTSQASALTNTELQKVLAPKKKRVMATTLTSIKATLVLMSRHRIMQPPHYLITVFQNTGILPVMALN